MPVDHDLLRSLASLDDPATGISETFVALDLRSGSTVGIVSRPREQAGDVGWVLCHSFAREQAELMPAEGAIARALAAVGYPTLRFHCQGYGESQHPELRATPATHLQDTIDAMDAFGEIAGVGRLGLVGIRVGAAIALAAAGERPTEAIAVIAPVLNGRRYVDQVIRGLVMTKIAMRTRKGIEGPETAGEIRAALEERGYLDYKGYVLTKDVVGEVMRLDAMDALTDVPARALVVQVSGSERPQPGLDRLVAALSERGAEVARETVLHHQAALYGLRHVRIVGRDRTADVFADLHGAVAGVVSGWARERVGSLA